MDTDRGNETVVHVSHLFYPLGSSVFRTLENFCPAFLTVKLVKKKSILSYTTGRCA